jgi:hypothetical protein
MRRLLISRAGLQRLLQLQRASSCWAGVAYGLNGLPPTALLARPPSGVLGIDGSSTMTGQYERADRCLAVVGSPKRQT